MSLRSRFRGSGGFSLIEVVLVVLIMSILASVAAQKYSGVVEHTRFDATQEEMDRISEAIVGNPALTSGGVRSDFGYVGDVGSLPPNLDALATNPGGYATWNGPYVQSDFQQNPNDYKEDAWGSTYTYSGGVTMASTGSGSSVTKQFASNSTDLLLNTVSGTVTDGLNNPPGDSAGAVTVTLRYPDGSGGITASATNPTSGGTFEFANTVPVGNHEITMVYGVDTLTRYVSVLPGSNAYANFRMAGAPWQPAGGGGGGGGGPTGAFSYVSGSAVSWSSGRHMRFTVANNSGASAQITSLVANYTATAFFERIRISGVTKFNSNNPRGAAGDTISFAAATVPNGGTSQIRFLRFRQCISGGCAWADIRGVDFTIVLNDGSTISFTVP